MWLREWTLDGRHRSGPLLPAGGVLQRWPMWTRYCCGFIVSVVVNTTKGRDIVREQTRRLGRWRRGGGRGASEKPENRLSNTRGTAFARSHALGTPCWPPGRSCCALAAEHAAFRNIAAYQFPTPQSIPDKRVKPLQRRSQTKRPREIPVYCRKPRVRCVVVAVRYRGQSFPRQARRCQHTYRRN